MNKSRTGDRLITWLFLLPAFITLGITALIPLLYSAGLSFQRIKLNIPGSKAIFVGMENYIRLIADYDFKISARNTIEFALSTVFLEMLLGLVIAMLLSSDDKRAKWIRALFLIPMIMAPVASGTLWRMMFDRTTGVVNFLLSIVHISPVNWLGTPLLAMISIIFVDVWRLTPWVTIIIVSAIKGISTSHIEAAVVDGARPWTIFTRIMFPLLKPVMIIILMIRVIDAFKVFDIVYVMTGGGPGMSTEMLPNYIYYQGLKYFDAGYAATIAWIFILAMSVITLGFVKLRNKEDQKVR